MSRAVSRAVSRFGFQTCAKPRFEQSRILSRIDRREFGCSFVEYVYLSRPHGVVRVFRRYGRGRREQWTTFSRIDPPKRSTAK